MSNGLKTIGEFKDEKEWNVKGYDEFGNLILKFVNGELQ